MRTRTTTATLLSLLVAAGAGLVLTTAAVLGLATATAVDASSGPIAPDASLPFAPSVSASATSIADRRLGSCYAFYSDDLSALAAAAGSGWDRFDFRWNVIEGEQARQPLDFSAHDQVVDRDVAHGIDVIGILGSTPKWAAPTCHVMTRAGQQAALSVPEGAPLFASAMTDAYWWRPCPPDGLDLPWDDPGNTWGAYVYATVDHFKDRVRVWEIWNEPDLGQTFWSGTPAEYAQLLKVGYQAVKAADPTATVLFAGLAYWSNPSYYVSVLDALATLPDAAANNYFFDAMSLHLYSNVYNIRPVATEIYANMGARVGGHPVWLTETGVPLWDEWPPDTPTSLRTNRATGAEAAAYAIQAFAEARAIGIERFLWFRNHDDYMGLPGTDLYEYFGLVRNDLTPRPAYDAFKVVAQYLHGENQVTGPFSDEQVRRITLWGTPHGRIDILWNETGVALPYSHTALLPAATVVDVAGVTQTVAADGGVLPLTLGAATANTAADGGFLIGGPPLLVIHEDTTAPASALDPLPTTTYSDAVTLSWDVVEDDAGLWYTEIERATSPSGPWALTAGWPGTQGVTQVAIPFEDAGTWWFRARARDHAGNWEAWPSAAEVSTSVILTRTVGISVTAYIDANANGTPDPGEMLLADASLSWRGSDGSAVTATVGATWEVTATLRSGTYIVSGRHPDYVAPVTAFPVAPAAEPARHEILLAFRAVVGRAYLPLLMRGQ